MKINTSHQSGFTLIEMMITVAIVAVLSAIALPSYLDYVARAQITEALLLSDGAKVIVADYYSAHGVFPTDSEQAGFPGSSGNYVASTSVGVDGEGVITTLMGNNANNKIAGKKIYLIPTVQSVGNVSWQCSSDAAQKYLPSSCTGS